MCEFKVKLIDNGKEVDLMEDVLFAQSGSGQVLLRNVLGIPETVDDAIIMEVSVPSEKMVLVRSPILGPLLKFLELQQKCRESKKFDSEIKNVWTELKRIGDKLVADLEKESGKD
ncbi:MAG: CooT family nickel-binding protein [Candidatus Helarchaeales archaeon]